MIRPAKFTDTPAVMALLRAGHAKSKYAHLTGIHEKSLEGAVMAMIAGQNQRGPGATLLNVAEEEGKVVGFIAGSLGRVYNIGSALAASDIFLINEGSWRWVNRLVDSYIRWASTQHNVIEIGLSWSNAVGGGETLRKMYERKGFSLVGETYSLQLDASIEEAA